MTGDVLSFALGISGFIIIVLIGIIGYFLVQERTNNREDKKVQAVINDNLSNSINNLSESIALFSQSIVFQKELCNERHKPIEAFLSKNTKDK